MGGQQAHELHATMCAATGRKVWKGIVTRTNYIHTVLMHVRMCTVISLMQHSLEDEQLIEACLNAGPPDGEIIIYDARSNMAATGNMLKVTLLQRWIC